MDIDQKVTEKIKEIIPAIQICKNDEKRLMYTLELFANDVLRVLKTEINRELNKIQNKYC